MKIVFKDFIIEASNLHEIAKAICNQITIPDDIPDGTPDKIECLKIGCGNYLSSRRVILKYFRRKRA